MLDILLKILSVSGMILLVLLLSAVVIILLVLFFPVTYRVHGEKSETDQTLFVRMNWLFGFLRVRYGYPEPGLLTARLLWFKLFQKKLPDDGAKAGNGKDVGGKGRKKKAGGHRGQESGTPAEGARSEEQRGTSQAEGRTQEEKEEPDTEETAENQSKEPDLAEPGEDAAAAPGLRERLFEKFQKIKYTICRIYDKIKEIWKNISYYTALLQEEETGELYRHAKRRVFRILKNIRPRHVRTDILFGTGAPDTTGYAYGAYCMFSPFLGPCFLVRPDFERAVFQGEFDISGHVTVFVLAVNIVGLVMDKKFQRFVKKLKQGKN